uniref:dTDP-4-dehydrorhamnose reductase (EC) n=1 Tax=Ganoderma boninense TaxID=34458 RepID=A0A5K1JTP4_9APHY|nr:dTDP-4-dehydrorhamnose reductase (EC [Ganoderma boninense]
MEACVASPSAKSSAMLSDPLWRADAWLLCGIRYPPLDPDAVDCNSDTGSDFMETTFPMFPYRFPSVTMPVRVRTVAFDLFGTILDRDGAIHDALAPWTFVSGCRKTAAQLTKIYLEREALLNYHSSTTPISLARVVHSALTEVSELLDLRISPHSAMFHDSMTRILAPTLFPDVEPAVTALAARGISLVCFPPHSLTTTAHYKSRLPRVFLDHVSFSPIAAPVHTAAPREMFRSISGEHTPQPRMPAHPELQPDRDSEILVVSTGVGRILAPAIRGKLATALLKRPESVEANVEFRIGRKPEDNPDPLLVVDGLMELCAALKLL